MKGLDKDVLKDVLKDILKDTTKNSPHLLKSQKVFERFCSLPSKDLGGLW
jgi:hypothetical protein